jgi:hypothetical protein
MFAVHLVTWYTVWFLPSKTIANIPILQECCNNPQRTKCEPNVHSGFFCCFTSATRISPYQENHSLNAWIRISTDITLYLSI